MHMTRRERLMATLRGETVDRPAVNFYEIGGLKVNAACQDNFNIYNHPSWQPLLELAEEETDIIRMRSPVRLRPHDPYASTRSGLNDFFKVHEYIENGSQFTRITLQIANRCMTSLTRRDPDINTIWIIEHLLKNNEDVEAYLQVPDDIFVENINIDALVEEDNDLGERGIVMVETEDPLCAAALLFSMEDFTIIALTEQRLFHRLLEKHSRYLYSRTERVAREFPNHLWRIYGPEYATEPYLPPHLFDEYVVRYTGPMVETIQKYGGFARLHIHGRIRNILPKIIAMGATAIDPIEPFPHGDVYLDDVRREYGRDLVLFGNIEVADIESMETAKFVKVVEKTIHEGTKGYGKGFVLMPSSSPYGRILKEQTFKNYETMVRLAKTVSNYSHV